MTTNLTYFLHWHQQEIAVAYFSSLMIFFRPKESNAYSIANLMISIYAQESGLEVDHAKSQLVFSKVTSAIDKWTIKCILSIFI